MQKGKKIIAFILILLLIIPLPAAASTKSITEVMDELKQAMKDLENMKSKIQDNTKKQRATAAQLKTLNAELQKTEKQIFTLEEEIAQVNESIDQRTQELTKTSMNLGQREKQLATRVRTAYKYSSFNFISILFHADSLADFLSRITILRRFISVDKDLISSIKEQKSLLEEETRKLMEEKEILQMQMQTMEYRKSEYQTRSSQRAALLKNLEKDKLEYQKALDELEKDSQALEKLLQEMRSTGAQGTGVLIWPAPNYYRITSRYGNRTHPITKRANFHTGIDIGIPHGKDIVAADSGVVVRSGSIGNYGLTVLIDHGEGMATLYAHNSRLLVKEGQVVVQGQTISHCGSTGMSTGPHLHFEVRINGKHTNPQDYVSNKR